MLVAFGSATNHVAFYPGSYPIEVHQKDLEVLRHEQGHHTFSTRRATAGNTRAKVSRARIEQHKAKRAAPGRKLKADAEARSFT